MVILNEREHRRHLPHFQNCFRTYFSTFVTRGRWLLPPEARDVVLADVLLQHQKTAFIHTAVVMPDHVHVVLQPLWDASGFGIPLSEIHRAMKGRSARTINQMLNRRGAFWGSESFDHQIRSDESLMAKCDYVAQNPVRKGLCATPEEWPWLFRWWIEGTRTG